MQRVYFGVSHDERRVERWAVALWVPFDVLLHKKRVECSVGLKRA